MKSDILKKNKEFLERTAKEEFAVFFDLATKYLFRDDIGGEREVLEITGCSDFNNKKIIITYWRGEGGAGYGFQEVEYVIETEKRDYTFSSREKAEEFLRNTKSKIFANKSAFKVKKRWSGCYPEINDFISCGGQLELEKNLLVLEKTSVSSIDPEF